MGIADFGMRIADLKADSNEGGGTDCGPASGVVPVPTGREDYAVTKCRGKRQAADGKAAFATCGLKPPARGLDRPRGLAASSLPLKRVPRIPPEYRGGNGSPRLSGVPPDLEKAILA